MNRQPTLEEIIEAVLSATSVEPRVGPKVHGSDRRILGWRLGPGWLEPDGRYWRRTVHGWSWASDTVRPARSDELSERADWRMIRDAVTLGITEDL
jgi:hypothetical protein